MRLYTRTKRRLASRQLVSAMGSRYQRKQTTRTAGQLGNGLSVIDGQLYDTGATNGHGTVAVVNVGRAAAAVYLPQSTGQVQISAGGGSCGSSGGTGIGIHALDGAYHTGTLAQSQAPWAALDSDLQDHMADPVHHDRQHSVISVDDHTVSAARYSVLGTPTAANTLAMWATSSNGTAGNALLRTDSNGAIYLNDLYAYDKVQSQSFVAGFAGSGYRLDYAVTSAGKSFLEVDDLSVRRRMTIRELLIRKIRTTNGDLFVSSGGEVESATDLGGGSWRLTFKEAHGFLEDDLIAAQAFTGAGVFRLEATVTAAPSTNQIDITLDDGGGETPATILAAGLALSFARHGSTSDPDRQGLLYLSSDDTGAPFLRVLDGIDAWADWGDPATVKMQAGRLDGITDAVLGDLSGYGLYGQNVYLTGILAAGGGDAVLGAQGLNIQAGTVSDGGWTNHSDKITFAVDPLADLDAENTIGQIGAVQFTSGSEIHRRLAARVQAGTAEQADAAIIELLAQYVDPEAAVPIQYAGVTMGVSDGAPYVSVGLQGSSAAAGNVLLQAPAITAYGHILADTDSAHDIGTADNRFRRLYVDEIVAGTTSSTDTGHNHDDRYYTKSTLDTALAGKAATTHDHAGLVSTVDLAAELADYATIAYVDAEIAALGAPDLGDYWTKAEADGRYADLTTTNAHAAATSAHGATGAVVGTTNTQTLTNKTLTAPVISQIKPSASNALTLPDRTDTLATLAGAETLSNKTLASPIVSGNMGIGVSGAANRLEVGGTLGSQSGNRINIVGSINYPGLGVGQDSNNRGWLLWDTAGGIAIGTRQDSVTYNTINLDSGVTNILGPLHLPDWTVDAAGRIESQTTVLGEPAVIITPAGHITAEHGRFRAALHAAVLEYDATMVSAGAQMWAHRGGAELYADLTVTTTPGSTVTVDARHPMTAPVQQYPIGCLILLEGILDISITPAGGPGSLTSMGIYHPQAMPGVVGGSTWGFGKTWLKVTAYSSQDGFGRYTCQVQHSTVAGTWPAGSAMVGFGDWLNHQTDGDRLGYLRITAMDDDSPAIDIVTLGAEPWDNTDLYRVFRAGKLDNLAIVTGSNVWGTAQGDLTGSGGYLLSTSQGLEIQDAGIDLRSDGQTRLRIDPDHGIRLFGQADRDTAILSLHDNKTDNAKIGHIAFDDVAIGGVAALKGLDIRGAFGLYDGEKYETGYLFQTANGYGSRVRVAVDDEGGGVRAWTLLRYEKPATNAPNNIAYSAYDVRADAINLGGRVGGMTRLDMPADTRLALAGMPRALINAQEAQVYESGGLVRVDTGTPYELIVTDLANNRVAINGTSTTAPTLAHTFSVLGSAYVSGNVGIGVSGAANRLEVGGTLGSQSGNRINIAGSSGSVGLGVGEDSDNRAWLLWDTAAEMLAIGTRRAATSYLDTITAKDGLVGIGQAASTYTLNVNGSVAGTSAYNNLSDARRKRNIVRDAIGYGLDTIRQLRPARFDYVDGPANQLGFVAQDLIDIIPEMVSEADDGTLSTRDTHLIPILVRAVQQLAARLDALEAQ